MKYTKIDTEKLSDIQTSFSESNGYTCVLPFANRESEIFLSKVLLSILKSIGREGLHESLEYALSELFMNASKANTKRLFFQKWKLDINNPGHYEKGMQVFKKEFSNNFQEFVPLHQQQNLFVQIDFLVEDNNFKISITNNSTFVKAELLSISEKIQKARKFNNLAEVMNENISSTEGGGYGLMLIVLMLRKLNLQEKALQFKSESGLTIVSIEVPLNQITPEHSIIISAEIAKELRQMPSMPESVLLLQKELQNPNNSFNSIAQMIKGDSTLSAEIIRVANSPVYKVPKKVDSVEGAVRLIGMLGVKALLYNYGANKIFEMKYDKKELMALNDHSFYVAQIASYIIQYKKLTTIFEDVYTAALLHDIGKIVINSLQPGLTHKLEKICEEKHIPISLLSELTEGYNHTIVGQELAKIWMFPEKYIQSIRYHHLPLECKDENKVIVYAVYLGNEIFYYLREQRDLHDINFQVLEFFNLHKETQFHHLVDEIQQSGIGGL